MTTTQAGRVCPDSGKQHDRRYRYLQLRSSPRVTADTQTGPSGTTLSTSEAYTNNGEATTENVHSGTIPSRTGHPARPGCPQLRQHHGDLSLDVHDLDGAGDRTCESNIQPLCTSNGGHQLRVRRRGRMYGVGFDVSVPNCTAPGLPTATECFNYDGNGALMSADYIEWRLQTTRPSPGIPRVVECRPWRLDSSYIGGVTQHYDFIDGPLGLPVEQVNINGSTSTPDWYYQDPCGNTRVLLDSSGNVDESTTMTTTATTP